MSTDSCKCQNALLMLTRWHRDRNCKNEIACHAMLVVARGLHAWRNFAQHMRSENSLAVVHQFVCFFIISVLLFSWRVQKGYENRLHLKTYLSRSWHWALKLLEFSDKLQAPYYKNAFRLVSRDCFFIFGKWISILFSNECVYGNIFISRVSCLLHQDGL